MVFELSYESEPYFEIAYVGDEYFLHACPHCGTIQKWYVRRDGSYYCGKCDAFYLEDETKKLRVKAKSKNEQIPKRKKKDSRETSPPEA